MRPFDVASCIDQRLSQTLIRCQTTSGKHIKIDMRPRLIEGRGSQNWCAEQDNVTAVVVDHDAYVSNEVSQ